MEVKLDPISSPSIRRILLSAYACEPGRGSEPGVGWNWALALARLGNEVWVITRENNRSVIEQSLSRVGDSVRRNLHFCYYDLPAWARRWKPLPLGVYVYYACWQRAIVPLARSLHRQVQFNLVQHITFGSWRQPSFLYRLGVPFIFGPVGGGEMAPMALERGFPIGERLRSTVRGSTNWLALWNPWLRQCLQRAVLVIGRTPETSRWVTRAGGAAAQSLEIGIDATAIDLGSRGPRETTQELRCLFAGRLVGWKGAHLAIEAIAKARALGADVTLTIIGRGPLRGRLDELVSDLGVQTGVKFIDWLAQSDLFEQYHHHDLLLFPSTQDSGGTVVLEALAHGLPVVCLDLGGPAVLVDPSCGAIVGTEGRSQEEVTDALATVLKSLDSRRDALAALARGAGEKALENTWEASVKRVYGLLPIC